MYQSIGVKSLGTTIPLAHDFTEQQCHDLMSSKYPDVAEYELRASYARNDSDTWAD